MAHTKKAKDPNKLGLCRLLAWKSSDVSAAWVNVIALGYLSIYASDTLGLSTAVVGTLLLVSKIIDGITDLVAGWLVDNTHTRLGKGRPYELCIIGQTICTILLFAGDPAWSNAVKCAWIFFMYTLTFSIFATLRNAGSTPYMIRYLSNNPALLRRMASYGGLVTMAASIGLNIVFPTIMGRFATSAGGWTTLVAIVMVPATLIGFLRFFLCKEDPEVDASSKQEPIRVQEILLLFRTNKYVWFYAIIMLCYNIMTNLSVNTYFFKWIIGDMSIMGVMSAISIVILPVMLTFPALMKKIGSMGKMVFYFCCIGIVGYIIAFISGSNLVGLFIGTSMGSFALLPLSYYGILFIMNICTYNEMNGMPRMDGSSGILAGFASKLGASLGTWITGMMLMLGGYISSTEAVEQPASALMMIRVDYLVVPAVLLVVIAICCLAFARLEPQAAAYEAQKKAAEEAQAANAAE